MKRVAVAIAASALVLGTSRGTAAPTVTLSVTPVSFSFPSGSPDTLPVSTGPTLTVRYSMSGGYFWDVWVLSVRAGGDLQSASGSIPVGNITWTAPYPLVGGTLSTTNQTLATGQGNFLQRTGYVTFKLQNLWTYKTGSYSNTIIFTMAAP